MSQCKMFVLACPMDSVTDLFVTDVTGVTNVTNLGGSCSAGSRLPLQLLLQVGNARQQCV